MTKILLNELLQLSDHSNVKVRFGFAEQVRRNNSFGQRWLHGKLQLQCGWALTALSGLLNVDAN